MHRFLSCFLLLILLSTVAPSQQAGGKDFALGGSSVMWIPRSGALFLNPAELTRLRHGEFLFNAHRFTTLSSFAATYFEPFVGTFAAGIANYATVSQYTLGYALSLGANHGFGMALSAFRNAEEQFGLSTGGSLHFPSSLSANSGFHLGLSVVNLSDASDSPFFSANAGAAYWVLPDVLRLQGAFQRLQQKNYSLVGIEVFPSSWFSLLLGARSFKDVTGGISFQTQHVSADFAAGKAGVTFSLNLRIGELASDLRAANYDLGEQAFDEKRFYDARRFFLRAYEYDQTFAPAREAAERSLLAMAIETDSLIHEARELEQRRSYFEAIKTYQKALQANPKLEDVQHRLTNLEPQIRRYVAQLIITGDSLRDRRELDRSRRAYQQVLELDPENDSLPPRIAELGSLVRENVRTILTRARSFLDRNQFDDAQKEYERVLAIEPRNPQARNGLDMIRSKRNDELLQQGKASFSSANYFEALSILSQVVERDQRNQDAKSYLERTREVLLPEVDKFFRAGLQFYTKENYKAALQEWDRALLIQPNHPGTLEYRKRAEEKLKALEKLK